MTSYTFNVILTLVTEAQIDNIVAAFVRRGRQVKPAASSGNLYVSSDDKDSTNAAVVLSLQVTGNFTDEKDDKVRDTFRAETVTLLKSLKVKYYSYVIFEPTLACWNIGNIEFPKPTEVTPQGPYR